MQHQMHLRSPEQLVFRGEPMVLDATTTSMVVLRDGEPTILTAADKRDMLKRLHDGEPMTLMIEAVTYVQRDGAPNTRYVKFQPKMLSGFAQSFVGQPFLRDHDQWSMLARGGTIKAAKSEKLEGGDGYRIRMSIELVKAWAVESALDGTLDRFSIGWRRTGDVNCSVHLANVRQCGCWPGDTIGEGAGAKTVEWVFTSAMGIECSGVNVPAVPVGTGIESVRQLCGLSSLDGVSVLSMLGSDEGPSKETTMDLSKLQKEFGLGADASVDDILSAARTRSAQGDQLVVVNGELAAARVKLAEVEALKKKSDEEARLAHVDASITKLKTAGKLAPGGKAEEALRRMASREGGLALFNEQVVDLLENGAQVTLAGAPVQASSGGGAPPAADLSKMSIDDILRADPTLARCLKATNVTKAEFEKHGLATYLERKRRTVAA